MEVTLKTIGTTAEYRIC